MITEWSGPVAVKRMIAAWIIAAALLVSLQSPSFADDEENGVSGGLNPDEMTLDRSLEMARRGKVDMVICAQGYLMVKKGDHEAARDIFRNCIKQGYTGAMTWMSYMEQNGLASKEDPAKAAEWDRKAAEAGDKIGMFNYGLDLLRGYGVPADEKKGRQFVDRAAESGVREAMELKDQGYDYRTVTPDADEWKYDKKLY